MYIKKTILIFLAIGLLGITRAKAQNANDKDHHLEAYVDSVKESSGWKLGHEGENKLDVEKFELAVGWDRKYNEALQIKFDWGFGTGHAFVTGSQEGGSHNFLDATIDVTYQNWPIHLGFSSGNDQTGDKPSTMFLGPNMTFFASDLKPVHKIFNIFRMSVIYPTFSQNVISSDSTKDFHDGLEYLLFFQTQQFEKGRSGFDYFSEGLFRFRNNHSIIETEFGLRHHQLIDNKLGIGLKLAIRDLSYDHFDYSLVIRYNVGNPNKIFY